MSERWMSRSAAPPSAIFFHRRQRRRRHAPEHCGNGVARPRPAAGRDQSRRWCGGGRLGTAGGPGGGRSGRPGPPPPVSRALPGLRPPGGAAPPAPRSAASPPSPPCCPPPPARAHLRVRAGWRARRGGGRADPELRPDGSAAPRSCSRSPGRRSAPEQRPARAGAGARAGARAQRWAPCIPPPPARPGLLPALLLLLQVETLQRLPVAPPRHAQTPGCSANRARCLAGRVQRVSRQTCVRLVASSVLPKDQLRICCK
ncbi:proline-rich protein 2-like [Vulpes lagopus]|uniref:proline-rich protein 2-like n=1 Tax=Vulpes lagopus TaxID=494514 RepID=UPI001BCA5377|nr:proline-rich protein 2-like [Vulpes lagopus]